MSYERSNKRSNKWLTLALLGLFFSGWFLRPSVTRSSAQPSQENPLQQAWEQARSVGVYDFDAEVQQTLRPRAIPEMIGQTSQSVNFRITGNISPLVAQPLG